MNPMSIICTAVIFIALEVVKVCIAQQLEISNNGPAVLDANITFSASLSNFTPKRSLKYIFDDGILKTEHSTQSVNITISRAFPSDLYKEGSHFMNVTVIVKEYFSLYEKVIAFNFSKFYLQRNLIGKINVFRDGKTDVIDVDEVAVGENVSLVLDLIDNSHYLEDASVDYAWSVDYEKHVTLGDTLVYNFTDEGVKDIKASVTATFPNNEFKYGYFERTVTAKVPVKNLNISGNPFIYHGDTLNLNVTCDGTPPFEYCFEFLRTNISVQNFTCTPISSFSICRMEIIKYFQDDGKYNVGIYVSNNVKEVKRVMEVMVYSVSVDPTLSTIIIPIVCSLLTLVIIAVGISYCIQQRNQLAVEVANFDFQDESDSYTERTFFENIFDSFLCKNCSRMDCHSPGEVKPLV